VTYATGNTVVAETAHSLYDDVDNVAPAHEAMFKITEEPDAVVARYSFTKSECPIVTVASDIGILFSDDMFKTARILAIGGAQGPAIAPTATTSAVGAPTSPPPTSVPHDTSSEMLRKASYVTLTRLITRDTVSPGCPTPQDFVDSLNGVHGLINGEHTFAAASAILGSASSLAVIADRIPFANATNMAAFLSFAFATTAPIITQSTKGMVISHLELSASRSCRRQASYHTPRPCPRYTRASPSSCTHTAR
jgi:hypothetical protein